MTNTDAVPRYIHIPAASFRTVLPPDGVAAMAETAAFQMRELPVSDAEFLAFVLRHPQWQRGKVASIFTDQAYLRHWTGALKPGDQVDSKHPVTHVSWFAAQAFCESEAASLPSWHEWELVAAADTSQRDARNKAEWQEQLLQWYSRPSNGKPLELGMTAPNVYGVRDMHGVIWEWVDDFAGVMVGADSREQGDPDLLKFCGAGAITVKDRENYPVLMRLAMLSSLKAHYTIANLGFRCVKHYKQMTIRSGK